MCKIYTFEARKAGAVEGFCLVLIGGDAGGLMCRTCSLVAHKAGAVEGFCLILFHSATRVFFAWYILCFAVFATQDVEILVGWFDFGVGALHTTGRR